MCLKSASVPKYTGDKEITCYKVLHKNFTSIYRGFPYYFHKLYNTEITFASHSLLPIRYWGSVRDVMRKQWTFKTYYKNYHEKSFWNNIYICCDYHTERYNDMILEGFHSFKEFNDAKIYYNIYRDVIVKCHIPKYTWYYEGIDSSTSFPSYTSESIILDEIINIC